MINLANLTTARNEEQKDSELHFWIFLSVTGVVFFGFGFFLVYWYCFLIRDVRQAREEEYLKDIVWEPERVWPEDHHDRVRAGSKEMVSPPP